MTITARYAGTCGRCGGAIQPGERIEWQRGGDTRHVRCRKRTSRARATARTPRREPKAGERVVARRSHDRDDAYEVGAVTHLRDGSWWTIVSRLPKYRDDDDDEWYCQAIARPATDEETAPVLARRAAAETRKAQLGELAALLSADTLTEERIPSDSQSLVAVIGEQRGRIWRGIAGHCDYYLAPDGTVWRSQSSYDDIPRQWHTAEPRAAEILRSLCEER